MPSEVIADFVDVPRPIAILLKSAYYVLLTLGLLASMITAGCLLWRFLGIGRRIAPSFSSVRADSYMRRHRDEESGNECAGLGFGNDTDEEYMRRPY